MADSYRVDAAEMLNWARYLEDLSPATNQAIAQGLNNYGEIVARKTAEVYAEKGDLQPSEVYGMIVIRPATARRLEWSMDASALKAAREDLARPIGGRDTNQYRDQELVSIIMVHDARGPCEICEEAAARGPYTQAQIDIIAEKWKDFIPARPVTGVRTNLLHPNAVLEGSRFASYGQVTEMVRAVFSAHAVAAETTVGRITIGPNHPILTRRGFVCARDLKKGDELLYDRRCEGSITGTHLNFDQMPFVEDAFAALAAIGEGPRSCFAAADDLHGDAVFCENEVDVVRAARPLLPILDPRGIEQFSELDFPRSDVELLVKPGQRSARSLFQATLATLNGFMRICDLPPPLVGVHGGPFDPLLFGSSSALDVGQPQHAIDDHPAGAEFRRQGEHALARLVSANDGIFRWDRVLDVHPVPFRGFAFDASTETGLYNSDGYVVHNCRCIVTPYANKRRLRMATAAGRAPPETFTAKQLAQVVAGELKVAIRAVRKPK